MFKLLSTMRNLGFSRNTIRFDIEFPTRNHLKVMLASLIAKRRKQLKSKKLIDMSDKGGRITLISSTDFCDKKDVSALCKVMTLKDGEEFGTDTVTKT